MYIQLHNASSKNTILKDENEITEKRFLFALCCHGSGAHVEDRTHKIKFKTKRQLVFLTGCEFS